MSAITSSIRCSCKRLRPAHPAVLFSAITTTSRWQPSLDRRRYTSTPASRPFSSSITSLATASTSSPPSSTSPSPTLEPSAAAAAEDTEIVILGAGPAGLSLAAALRSSPFLAETSITLLEGSSLKGVRKWSPDLSQHGWSNRVSSITEENLGFLRRTGIARHLHASRMNPISALSIHDGISNAALGFDSPPNSSMSSMVENIHLQSAALASLESPPSVAFSSSPTTTSTHKKGIDILDGTKVVKIEADRNGWPLVHLSTGRVLKPRLLIGADGPNSPVKKYSGIESFGWGYKSVGMVATVGVEGPFDYRTAVQRFLPDGPIAFLPLSSTTASIVYTTSPSHAAHLLSLPASEIPSILNAALSSPSYTTPRITHLHPGSLQKFPLRLSHSTTYTGPRTVLVGDAAHTVHPLAGQGLNLALGDSAALLGVLEKAVREGGDLGSPFVLEQYTRERYLQNHVVLSACDHLASLYGSTNPLVVAARSNGVEVLNELDSVKSWLMGFAGSSSRREGNGRAGGVWEGVAGAVEAVGKGREMVGFVGGLVGSLVKAKVGEFVGASPLGRRTGPPGKGGFGPGLGTR